LRFFASLSASFDDALACLNSSESGGRPCFLIWNCEKIDALVVSLSVELRGKVEEMGNWLELIE
jgi:hypothetical protein